MRKGIMVYLAGACKNIPDEGREWRLKATRDLRYRGVNRNCDINIINPLYYFSYSENRHQSHKQVKMFYLDRIRHCDLVLVNLDDSDSSVGTGMEVQCAVDNNIPVIGFGTKNMYPWISEVDCQATFPRMEEAIEYIGEYYM
jgi:nucleoside 2-deoxyribosyltransferase